MRKLVFQGFNRTIEGRRSIAASSINFVPTKNDLVIVNGNEEYEILKVTKEEQANIAIVYTLFLTRAT